MATLMVTLQEIKRFAIWIGALMGLFILMGTMGYYLLGH